jgi:hypothetical protein
MLVVPVDVVALPIGEVDEQEATNEFAGATAVYSALEKNGAALGSNVVRDFDADPWEQMKKGVHLHWALPDALTHSGTEGGGLEFPAVPNRWLVTRLTIDGAKPTASSWLIESDALQAEQTTDQMSPTVPVKRVEFPDGYAYLGRITPLDEEATALAAAPAPLLLRDHAETELTAVTNGEIGFAAYYPSAGGALGFYDALEDLEPPAEKPARLSYAVIGWYDLESNDPVAAGSTATSLAAEYGWTFAGDAKVAGSLYSGLVQGIPWSPHSRYVHGQKVQEPIAAEVAIGSDSAAALAGYLSTVEGAASPLFEQILDAFQRGLIDSFKQPAPNQIAALAETLHDAGFAGLQSGIRWAIGRVGSEAEEGTEEAIELPLPLAEALNRLNQLQERANLCGAHVAWFRRALFADWYRIFMASDPNTAFQAATERFSAWPRLEAQAAEIAAELKGQREAVAARLGTELELKEAPATRFQQPTDPVVMLTGEELEYPERHGGDGRFDAAGHLVCRTSEQLLGAEEVEGEAIAASDFTGVAAPAALAHSDLLTAILREACLLDTDVAAALSGAAAKQLEAALRKALEGGAQSAYRFTAGLPPSAVAVNWWAPDLWLPLFLSWRVEYLPLQPTVEKTKPLRYDRRFFAANYAVAPNAGGAIAYRPDGSPQSIKVQPGSEPFPQGYEGGANLTPSAADALAAMLAGYLGEHSDPTLEAIENRLLGADFVTAPLSGLTDLLLMQNNEVQLQVRADPESNYAEFTDEVRQVVGDGNRVGPQFNGWFNPIRAGYLKVALDLVDTFGQKREVKFPRLICSAAMTTEIEGEEVPSVAYLQPRLAQPSRLLFRWLAADGTDLEEMNSHPATTPVCGWLLPNHLDGSLFLYSAGGRPLGTLFLVEGQKGASVGWQSAPGDDATIDQPVAEAMRYENPRLRDLAVALRGGSAEFFRDFWRAIDAVGDNVEPGAVAGDAGMATLVGRPLAVTQAMLRLEVEGRPALDLGWDIPPGVDSDAGVGTVSMPVILGDLENLGDGLVGYFKGAAEGYDLATFYTEGAPRGSEAGVMRPDQGTLEVTTAPRLDESEPPDLAAQTRTVLMVIDPRAAVHATSGYLPTASLTLPPDMSNDEIASFDMSFFTSPVLKGAGGLTIPTPRPAGYQVAWVEEDRDGDARRWAVTPEIEAPPSEALWPYTDQTLAEGWLRLNPLALEFSLLDRGGNPVVTAGVANALTLTVTNAAGREVTFLPGAPVAEGSPEAPGSVFYLHLGPLVSEANVPAIAIAAPGWTFQAFASPQYGAYWAAAPSAPVELAHGESIEFAVTNLLAAAEVAQTRAYFDYYHLAGVNDGVFAQAMTVESRGG